MGFQHSFKTKNNGGKSEVAERIYVAENKNVKGSFAQSPHNCVTEKDCQNTLRYVAFPWES